MKISNFVKKILNLSSKNEDNSNSEKSEIKSNEDISEKYENIRNGFEIDLIDISPNLYLACRGSKICVNKEIGSGSTFKDRLNYISKVIGRGHESVLEHTNIIFVLKILKSTDITTYYYSELFAACKFLNIRTSFDKDHVYILFGGSIRAFKYLISNVNYLNPYLIPIRNAIYHSIEKEFLRSLIDEGLLDEESCIYFPETNVDTDEETGEVYENDLNDPQEIKSDYADLVYTSNLDSIFSKIKKYGFTMSDVYRVAIVSFIFHDISRSCANQIVRHRNGISQESQRYVTKIYQPETDFIDPIEMNYENRYKDRIIDKTCLQKIEEIKSDVFRNYKYLISAAVFKEDARAWLPMNVTTRLMMTFTYFNFAKFLELRLDKAAQLEIRRTAKDAANHIFENEDKINSFIFSNKKPHNKLYGEDYTYQEIDDDVTNESDMQQLKLNSLKDAEEYMKKNSELKEN